MTKLETSGMFGHLKERLETGGAKWGGLILFLMGILTLVLYFGLSMPELSLTRVFSDPESLERSIFLKLQLPRFFHAFFVGATLGLSGAVIQGLLRNPLADPYILGVSGGAALGTALVTLSFSLWGWSLPFLTGPIGGFMGALLALAVVIPLGSHDGRPSPFKMLLIGVLVNAISGSLLMVLSSIAEAGAVQHTLVRLMGSLGVDPSQHTSSLILACSFLLTLAISLPFSRALDILSLGDEGAESLGLQPASMRRWLLIGLSLPIGALVSVTGMIGFVGLLVPHAVRLLFGPKHKRLLLLSAFFGAMVVILSDALVSFLAPLLGTELPVGVVTALLGGPLFLFLIRQDSGVA